MGTLTRNFKFNSPHFLRCFRSVESRKPPSLVVVYLCSWIAQRVVVARVMVVGELK